MRKFGFVFLTFFTLVGVQGISGELIVKSGHAEQENVQAEVAAEQKTSPKCQVAGGYSYELLNTKTSEGHLIACYWNGCTWPVGTRLGGLVCLKDGIWK